jgi:hypothetical protein
MAGLVYATYRIITALTAHRFLSYKVASFVGADHFRIVPRKGEYLILDKVRSPAVLPCIHRAPCLNSRILPWGCLFECQCRLHLYCIHAYSLRVVV